ncbi:NAD-dependent deacylase [Candidatus Kapabacteria bacterium]|nr:NAD-dependent deacylase [Candidatus Kapabacteria bacterium]
MEYSENFVNRLLQSKRLVILTGAGTSAESGIATFRDPEGLWSKFDPLELASIDGFLANPKLVWEWYQYRVNIINNAKPNGGHLAITELQKIKDNLVIVTQNVDRLHQKAGSKNVIELHGDIITNRCFDCEKQYLGKTLLPNNELPKCNFCNGKIRPNVVWFGEQLPQKAISDSENHAKKSDVFLIAGTSSEVYPAAGLSYLAKQYGSFVIEINPNETNFSSSADYIIREKSSHAFQNILNILKD